MNEIIKRLAEQAVAESNLPDPFWWIVKDPKMTKVAERFALLIIEECIDKATIGTDYAELDIRSELETHFGIRK